MTHQERFMAYQKTMNEALDRAIAEQQVLHGEIFRAMRYSLNGGGKRIRPILVLEFARICGLSENQALPYACAIEMVHTYSLIHDDLPCMDDDKLRRGRPTSHIIFGEALAVLAGDALLNLAFEHMLHASATGNVPAECYIAAMSALADASGSSGMIGGQVIDMEGEKRNLNEREISQLHALKTGALIRAACEMGCLLAGADANQCGAARTFAEKIGLAFQMKDDILNVEGDSALLGKDVGNDERSGKSTFVKLKGLDPCKLELSRLTNEAVDALVCFDDREFLTWLANDLASRNH